jgi:hypothetical protein
MTIAGVRGPGCRPLRGRARKKHVHRLLREMASSVSAGQESGSGATVGRRTFSAAVRSRPRTRRRTRAGDRTYLPKIQSKFFRHFRPRRKQRRARVPSSRPISGMRTSFGTDARTTLRSPAAGSWNIAKPTDAVIAIVLADEPGWPSVQVATRWARPGDWRQATACRRRALRSPCSTPLWRRRARSATPAAARHDSLASSPRPRCSVDATAFRPRTLSTAAPRLVPDRSEAYAPGKTDVPLCRARRR